jgi:hypothetical protein
MKLNNSLYDATVISAETDRTLSGAVRVSIIGVTDGIEDEVQPLALPALNNMMAVPTKGTHLKVYFEEGDVHQPVYLGVSPQTSFLPDEYRDNYPNVAVSNLGSDFFQKIHNRAEKSTRIEHDSNSIVTWDALGVITHDSEKGYENTGFGAKQNNGKPIQPVLTEGTIDIFTCTPFAGGSEYLKVTHISKASVLGTIERQQQLNATTTVSEEDTGFDAPVTKPLLSGTVEFLQAKNSINISNRKVKIILIGNTGINDFSNSLNSILNSSVSAHYVIGKSSGELIQMIDLTKGGTFGSKGIWNKETSINKITISVLLCGDGKSAFTPDQYNNLNSIVANARQQFGNEMEIVTIAEVDPLMVGMFGTTFDKSKVI